MEVVSFAFRADQFLRMNCYFTFFKRYSNEFSREVRKIGILRGLKQSADLNPTDIDSLRVPKKVN